MADTSAKSIYCWHCASSTCYKIDEHLWFRI